MVDIHYYIGFGQPKTTGGSPWRDRGREGGGCRGKAVVSNARGSQHWAGSRRSQVCPLCTEGPEA